MEASTDPARGDITAITPAELAAWPGAERRDPPRSDRHYLALSPLAHQLRAEIARLLQGRDDAHVLDIGCGAKPYLPFVAPYAGRYVGVDTAEGPYVDHVTPAEQLPFEDEAFDLVLCTQVLEHVQDPAAVLSEIHRVLRPGGAVLLSTHGVFLFHPDPPGTDGDYWRWTHAGLRKMVGAAGDWREVEVQPNGDVVACLAYIAAQFVDEFGARLGFDPLRRGLLFALNSFAELMDRRCPRARSRLAERELPRHRGQSLTSPADASPAGID
jgi:SAM-dependent methyltransferase